MNTGATKAGKKCLMMMLVISFIRIAQSENLHNDAYDLSPSTNTTPVNVSALSSPTVYGGKAIVCSEVIGPNTKYDPNSLNGLNVLSPDIYAVNLVVKPLPKNLPYSDESNNKLVKEYESKLKGARTEIIKAPKYGKLLPVQHNGSTAYFYLAQQGYFGRDEAVFRVIFADNTVVILTNTLSVVDYPIQNKFNLEHKRSGDPCSTTQLEYQEMRRKKIEDIKRQWEELNISLKDNDDPVLCYSDGQKFISEVREHGKKFEQFMTLTN